MRTSLRAALTRARTTALEVLDAFQTLTALRRDDSRQWALHQAMTAAGKPPGLWEILTQPEPGELLPDAPGRDPAVTFLDPTYKRFCRAAKRFSGAVDREGKCPRAALDALAIARRTWEPTFTLSLPLFGSITEASAHVALFKWAVQVREILTDACEDFPAIPVEALPLCYHFLADMELAAADLDTLRIQLQAEVTEAGGKPGIPGRTRAPVRCHGKTLNRHVENYILPRLPFRDSLIPAILAGDRAAAKKLESRLGPTAIFKALTTGRFKLPDGAAPRSLQNIQQRESYKAKVGSLFQKPPRAPADYRPPQPDLSSFGDGFESMRRQVEESRR